MNLINKIQQKLNQKIADNSFSFDELNPYQRPGMYVLFGYYPVNGFLHVVAVDVAKGIMRGKKVPAWQIKWLKTEQNIFFVMDEKRELVLVNGRPMVHPVTGIPLEKIEQKGIWFKT